jgi:competence protein ComEC
LLAAGLLSPLMVRPADLLISDDARLIAVRTPAGIFLEEGKGASRFTREDWDGYWADGSPKPMPQTDAAADGAIVCDPTGCMLRPRPDGVAAFLVRMPPLTPETCGHAAILVAAAPARGLCPRPWPALVDRFTVWRFGATAVWLAPHQVRIVTDRGVRSARPWVIPLPERRAAPVPPPTLPLAPVDVRHE